MTLRTGHGTGTGSPRIEVLPSDELPSPVAAPAPSPTVPLAFRQDGTIADSETARALGRRGGLSKAQNARSLSALGLAELATDSEFRPYRTAGDDFVRQHLAALAAQCGGAVGPAPSSIVASAGLQLAASRFVSDRAAVAGDAAMFKLASQLANDSRQNLLAAYELAVREAQARSQNPAGAALPPWMHYVDDGQPDEAAK